MKMKNKKKKSLSTEIRSSILGTIIPILVIVGVIVGFTVATISLSSQKNDLEMQSKAAAYQLENFFGKYTTITEQLSLDTDIKEILTNTKAGDSLVDAETYDEVFDEMLRIADMDSENIQAVWISDIDANMVTQSDGYTSDDTFEITERSWYAAVETKSSMLTSAYQDVSTGNMILSAASPVYDEKGNNIIGVAGIDILLDHIDNVLPAYKIGNEGFVILVTSEGTILYHPNEDNELKTLGEVGISDAVMSAIESEKNTSVSYSADGVNKKGYVDRIGETEYYVLSSLPSSEYYQSLTKSILAIIIMIVICVILICVLSHRMSSSITKPIISLNNVAQELAAGNLNVNLDVNIENEVGELADSINQTVIRLKEYINYIDEISYVLNRIADGKLKFTLKYDYAGEFAKVKESMLNISDSLQSMIKNIINSSSQVAQGADDLSKAAQSIAENATSQAASVEELTATTVSVSEQVNENTIDARKSASETDNVTRMMQASKEQMNQMAEAMQKINDTSTEVVTIIKTIEDIAGQTNLLALNASIEAARAGDAGKGFAVVASEIGGLAEGSSKAANNTKELIGISIQEIERGNALVTDVVASMQNVLAALENVNDMTEKSAENGEMQNQSIEQIRNAVEEIAKGVEDSSAVAEETSATSEELAAQAATLEEMVKHFDLNDTGAM